MPKQIIDTINRTADAAGEEKPVHSKQDLISWAAGCMLEGLPDVFYKAWVGVLRGDDTSKVDYHCILEENGETESFRAADDLYPIQCIEHLDGYLPKEKRNWVKCWLVFNTESASIRYEY